MFSHIVIGTNDIATAKKFYDAVLGGIGVPEGDANEARQRVYYRTPGSTLIVAKPIDGNSATGGNGSTLGFGCETAEQVDAFHDTAVANGGTSIEDPPGWRNAGGRKLYLCYVRDPSGNKLCAMIAE
jgi:catechol 2,3-dioxygenase-like lactoylglutathione lyase family enzyme